MSNTQEQLADLSKQVADLASEASDLNNRCETAVVDTEADAKRAEAGADRSTAQADKSVVNNSAAQAAKNEAVAAKEEALAIVHSGEGSLTASAGKYPVADSNGRLDVNWTPLLAAMYPYSGVIGSMDKEDLFAFYHASSANSNKIYFQNTRKVSFNINGRRVLAPTSNKALPEAESTADRAIAFDDIFLDWNGNVVTYRSITPHRTVTGYDRDAIASEHGYTKVQTGLYRTSDSATYLLLLGRVARRNRGAYHPVYNPEGSKAFRRADLSQFSENPWNSTLIPTVSTAVDCFTAGIATELQASGSLIGKGWRPDNYKYDAIYTDDFTPLYYSAKNVIDRQALLFDSFNRAVAGETFSGAEGTPASVTFRVISYGDDYRSEWVATDTGINSVRKLTIHEDDRSTVNLAPNEVGVMYYNGGSIFVTSTIPDDLQTYSGSTFYICDRNGNPASNIMFDFDQPLLFKVAAISARPRFLMCDIIGSLDAMPQEWLDNGIPGNWLSVGEEGESLIPDGTAKNYKLSRKCLECYQVLETTNNGTSWVDVTNLYANDFMGAANAVTATRGAQLCQMVFYRTRANPFELADNAVITAINKNVLVAQHNNLRNGSLLASNCIGKVTTHSRLRWSEFTSLGYRDTFDRFSEFGGASVHHDVTSFITSGNPTIKVFSYLSPQGFLQIIYKEMKHNGTSWGDDNKFNIVNNQSTVTDLNGEEVVVGQKRVELPYHFDGETY